MVRAKGIALRQSALLLIALLLAPGTAAAVADRLQPNLSAGIAALEREDYRVALKELERAIVADPRNPDAYDYLGRAHQALGDYRAALKYYGISLELDPNHRPALLHRGEAQLKTGDLAAAQATLERLGNKCDNACEQFERLRREVGNYKAGRIGRAE